MKNRIKTETMVAATPTRHGLCIFGLAALLTLAWMPLAARNPHKASRYQQFNLVSDVPGAALLNDPDLVNAWGMSFGPMGPFWVSNAGTDSATIYDVTYDTNSVAHVVKQGRVSVPGEPTGQLFNGAGLFHGDIFVFVGEEGTISGWRGALGTVAETLTNRPTAVYKGVALARTSDGPLLLAANFSEGTVDAYDTNLTLVAQFTDPDAPAGYAPFNVQSIGNVIFVTFAMQDEEGEDDVPGRGHGLIDVLDPETGTFHRFVTGKDAGGKLKEINSPWGIALAPSTFGDHADELLVANFGDGTIMAFDASGRFRGLLESDKHEPIAIEGLWGLAFGNGAGAGSANILYFTAGPEDETHGLFGSIELVHPSGSDGTEDE